MSNAYQIHKYPADFALDSFVLVNADDKDLSPSAMSNLEDILKELLELADTELNHTSQTDQNTPLHEQINQVLTHLLMELQEPKRRISAAKANALGSSNPTGKTNSSGKAKPSDSTDSEGMMALFEMEGILLELERKVLESYQQEAQQRLQIGAANEKVLQDNYKNLQKQIEQQHEKHSFWGFLKHLFTFVVHIFIAEIDAITGNISGAKNQLEKAIHSPFIQDLKNLIMLIVDALGAYYCAIFGQEGEAKKLGEKILQNPALQMVADIISVAMIVVGFLTGQPELAMLAIALMVLTDTGALQDMTKDIAKSMGDSKLAKIIADILVIVIVAALSFGAGAASAVEDVSVTEIAEEGAELGSEIGQEGSELGSEVAEEGEEATQQASDEASSTTKRVFNAKKAVGFGALGGSSALGSSSLAFDIINSLNLSKKTKEKLEIILEIIQELIALVGAIAGGKMALSSSGTSVISQGLSKASSSLFPSLMNSIEENGDKIMNFAQRLQLMLPLAKGVVSAGLAGSKVQEAMAQKLIGQLEAVLAEVNAAQEMNTSGLKASQKHFKSVMQSFMNMIQNFDPSVASEANADALLQNA